MQLDDERESDYVEDRRSDDGGVFDDNESFGGRPYGGGGQYDGNPNQGGPFSGLSGGILGGIIGGLLGGMFNRPNSGDPYAGRAYGNSGGSGLGGKIGIGIVIIVVALLVSYFLNADQQPQPHIQPGPAPRTQTAPPMQRPHQQDRAGAPAREAQAPLVSEVKKVLAKTEDTWDAIFKQMGRAYQKPRLVLFTNATQTACGQGRTATGPFYCPPDQRIYLDLRFFNEMERRFHASGDFARAYVVAHEVGHHVQNQMGTMQKVNEMRSRMSQKDFNKVSVQLELQADCLAGVWAYHANRAKPFLDPGDIEEALKAANAVGDDTIQRATRGSIVPDAFTHGTSAQRVHWFKTGFENGNMKTCDTFRQPV